MRRIPRKALLWPVLLALLGAGCGRAVTAADKAGGSPAHTSLRLGYVDWTSNGEDRRLVRRFADAVRIRSGGRLDVRVVDAAYHAPDEEERIVHDLRQHRFDLGWITAGAWDARGIDAFAALQAPFLVDGYRLLDAIARGPLARRMLDRLELHGFVGLALVPDALLHPASARPLLRPSDYRGLQFLVLRSQTMNALLRSLGGKPRFTVSSMSANGPAAVIQPTWHAGEYVLTANVVLFPRVETLFANADALRGLAAPEREALRLAAGDVVSWAISRRPTEQSAALSQCQTGTIALADPEELRALRHAALPVTAGLEAGPETRAIIAAIRLLKGRTAADPPLHLPRGCARTGGSKRPPPRGPLATLDGTYRYVLTRQAALAYFPVLDPGSTFPLVATVSLRDGRWLWRGDEVDRGAYTVSHGVVTFRRRGAETIRFRIESDAAGDLRLRPVLPMNRGDQFVWSSAPWRRIGS